MPRALTIGAHQGGLGRAQAEETAKRLRDEDPSIAIHLELITLPNSETGLHDDHVAENRTAVAHLHERLRAGDLDLVVHRGFDLRSTPLDGLIQAAIPPRGSPYDSLVSPKDLTLDELGAQQRLGVVQLRAKAQLVQYRPDLQYELIRGDVGRWLTAMIDGEIDALVAPNAALEQLGLQERVNELFPPEMVVPAPGSGVLVCLCREDDRETYQRLQTIHHATTELEYAAERAFLEELGAPWEAPIGALAQRVRDEMAILGLVASPDGERVLRRGVQAELDDPRDLGCALAELLMENGATDILGLDQTRDEPFAGLLADATDWDDIDPEDPAP